MNAEWFYSAAELSIFQIQLQYSKVNMYRRACHFSYPAKWMLFLLWLWVDKMEEIHIILYVFVMVSYFDLWSFVTMNIYRCKHAWKIFFFKYLFALRYTSCLWEEHAKHYIIIVPMARLLFWLSHCIWCAFDSHRKIF